MKKMLFVGDSITEGWLGASYIRMLRKSLKGYQFINRGLGGDTLAGISHRIPILLKRREPDILVIQAGTHDLLLPYLLQRGGTWKVLVDQFVDRGSIYARDKSDFQTRYQNLLEVIRSPRPDHRFIDHILPGGRPKLTIEPAKDGLQPVHPPAGRWV